MDRRTFLKVFGCGGASLGSVRASDVLASTQASGPRYAMLVDLRRCVGCQSCTVSCAVENRAPLGSFRTTVGEYALKRDGDSHPAIGTLPRLCNHCEKPACLPVCPAGATRQRPDGIVVVDAMLCLGCGFCVQACPYDARFINHQTRTADKCTFCAHRIAAGLLPVCVENCVGGARIFGDLNASGSLVRKTLEAAQGYVSVLYPEMNTRPAVYYLALEAGLVAAPAGVKPLLGQGRRDGGARG